jgi:hypothetical protein
VREFVNFHPFLPFGAGRIQLNQVFPKCLLIAWGDRLWYVNLSFRILVDFFGLGPITVCQYEGAVDFLTFSYDTGATKIPSMNERQ